MILGQLCAETMKLEAITRLIQPLTVQGQQDLEIKGLAYDSRRVRPGYLFAALDGALEQGRSYIDDAVKRGAIAVLSGDNTWNRAGVTHIRVADARQALAEIACAYHDHPSSRLDLIGVTGTNGKTTVAFMARDILRAAGRAPGLIGTVQYEMGERCIPAIRTTPEAPDIQEMLAAMLQAGCRSAVMEVSSHGLAQKRAWGTDFNVGVFTNLTQDHLDYHGSMEAYFQAKTQLFQSLGQADKSASAVLNLDDAWGQRLANTNGFSARIVTYGLHPNAMVRAEDVDINPFGCSFRAVTPWGQPLVRIRLPGRFNVSNALAAIAACGALDVPPTTAAEALAAMRPVPGRLEPVPNPRGVHVFVDYAHTPDALWQVLTTLRELGPRRLICVFGCGGQRDRAKRPLMGEVVTHGADLAVVTTDNPRSEDPQAIIDDILAGSGVAVRAVVELDRERAITLALKEARPGDIVVIAGKGHETYQEWAHTVTPFDDRAVAAKVLGG